MTKAARLSSEHIDQLYEELARLPARERRRALSELEHKASLSPGELAEVSDYFRIAHDRRDTAGLVGQTLGKYRLVDVLGQGGCSVVYFAETLSGGIPCALKLPLPEAPLELHALFDAEAEKLERIQEPGVVRMLDHGIVRGPTGQARPFLVTELIFGWTLGKYVERRQPPVEERVGLVASVAETLAIVHARHAIVHLDLKPDNILVDSLGRQPRLVDFGIARVLGPGLERAQPSGLTPRYASPEQLFPERFGLTGSHSDQYSLALVLRRLLGAEPPAGEERVLGTAWVRAPFRRSELRGLGTVLSRALEPEAARRYPDMASFARALRDEAATLPARRRWTRRLHLLAGVTLALLASLGVELATRPLRAEAKNRAGRSEQEAKRPLAAARAFAEAARLDPTHSAALYNGAAANEDLGDLARARALYQAARESATDPVPALNNLARVLVLSGQAAEAIPLLEQALAALPSDDHLDTLVRAYHLRKNLGWAELELARTDALGRRAALTRAEQELRLAVAKDAALREHDALSLPAARMKLEDAAAYCLLGAVLAEDGSRIEQSKNWWRRCLAADAHSEPIYERWKNEAHSVLAR